MFTLVRVQAVLLSALAFTSPVFGKSAVEEVTEDTDRVSWVQAGVIMSKKPRRVGSAPPVVEEDADDGINEEDETMLMQSELCTHKSCPGVPKMHEDSITDDTSLLQAPGKAIDDDETSFFQTGIIVSKSHRKVGVPMEDDEDEEGYEDMEDGASFLQATVALEEGDHTACSNLNVNHKVVGSCVKRVAAEDEELEDDLTML